MAVVFAGNFPFSLKFRIDGQKIHQILVGEAEILVFLLDLGFRLQGSVKEGLSSPDYLDF